MDSEKLDAFDPNDLRGERFVVLLSQHERRINACVLALVPNWSDAEDILQEVKLLMWRQFGSFDESGDFGAWACTIIRNVVRTRHRRQQGKPNVFGQEFLDKVEREFATRATGADRRQGALATCLGELKQSSREFLKRCYDSRQTIAAIASGLGRSADSVYKQLERIRRDLRDCMDKKLHEEGES